MDEFNDISKRLPNNIIPHRYYLSIKPVYPELDKFFGKCIIYFVSNKNNADSIILNMVNIEIMSAVMIDNCNNKIKIKNIIHNESTERVKFVCDRIPIYGHLKIKYIGKISTELTGVIKARHGVENVVYTQFEPHSARRCFPCMDEPSYKAIYEINIKAPSNKIILSNSPIKYTVNKNNSKRVYFEDTPVMSTYLVAFYIGHANSIHRKTKYNINLRIFSIRHPDESVFALNVAEKTLNYLTEFFDYKYPIKKLDLVAVPQFAAAAMENWGLVIFREKCLITEKNMLIEQKIRIAYVIAHELAHQWFGNLVTMEWWDDLWLNESFATWAGWHVTDKLFPEWNVWEHFYINENMIAMDSDSVENSHPIKVSITNVNNVNEIFDEISYSKGGSVLRMLIETIGMVNFKKGMRMYFKNHAYKNCTTDDLWIALSESSDKDIGKLMNTWINSIGYPIIYCYKKNNKIKLYQEKFTYGIDQNACVDIWSVPIVSGIIDKKTHVSFGGAQCINPKGIGYYRVNYQPELLAEIISGTMTNLDFAHILNDLYYLLKARLIKLNYYLDTVSNIIRQLSRTDVSIAIANSLIERYHDINILNVDSFSNQYKIIITDYVEELLDNIKSKNTLSDDTVNEYVENSCIKFKLLSDKNYLKKNKNNFNIKHEYLIMRAILTHKIDSYESCANSLLRDIVNETKQESIANVLGFVSDQNDYKRVLELILSPIILNQYKINLINSCGKNKLYKNLLWTHIKKNWSDLYECFKNNQFGLNRTIQSLENISDDSIANDINSFFTNKPIDGMKNSLNCVIENIKINSVFVEYINNQQL